MKNLFGWVVLLSFAAYILRAAIVWLADVIEGEMESPDDDGAAWPKSSALPESVKPTAEGSANQ